MNDQVSSPGVGAKTAGAPAVNASNGEGNRRRGSILEVPREFLEYDDDDSRRKNTKEEAITKYLLLPKPRMNVDGWWKTDILRYRSQLELRIRSAVHVGKGYDLLDRPGRIFNIKSSILDQKVPFLDEVMVIVNCTNSTESTKHVVIDSEHSYNRSVNVDAYFQGGKVATGLGVKASHEAGEKGETVVFKMDHHYALHQVRLGASLSWMMGHVSQEFLAMKEDLIDGRCAPEDLINVFGTHLITDNLLGYRLTMVSESDMQSRQEIKNFEVKFKLEAMQLIKTDLGINNETLDENKQSSEMTKLDLVGLKENVLNVVRNGPKYDNWKNDLPEDVGVIDIGFTNLIPIYKLFSDDKQKNEGKELRARKLLQFCYQNRLDAISSHWDGSETCEIFVWYETSFMYRTTPSCTIADEEGHKEDVPLVRDKTGVFHRSLLALRFPLVSVKLSYTGSNGGSLKRMKIAFVRDNPQVYDVELGQASKLNTEILLNTDQYKPAPITHGAIRQMIGALG